MLRLEPFGEQDFLRLIHWIDSFPLMIQWAGIGLGFKHPLDEEQLRKYLQPALGDHPIRLIFKVLIADEAVGHIELDKISKYNGTASICRVFLRPAYRGQGLCAEMIREILKIGFGQLNLRRIDLGVFAFNTSAIKCYEKTGFVKEGALRKAVRVEDQFWDGILMGMLKEEWQAKKA